MGAVDIGVGGDGFMGVVGMMEYCCAEVGNI